MSGKTKYVWYSTYTIIACMQIASASQQTSMHAWCNSQRQESKPNKSSSTPRLLPPNESRERDMKPWLLGEEGKLCMPAPASMSTPAISSTGQYSAGADPTVNADVVRPKTSASCPPAYCVNFSLQAGDGEPLGAPSSAGKEL